MSNQHFMFTIILSFGIMAESVKCFEYQSIYDLEVKGLANIINHDQMVYNSTIDLAYESSYSKELNFSAMIPALLCLEVICFILLGLLFYLANNALS